MSESGLSQIKIENEKLLVLEDALGFDKAKSLANQEKLKAFGGLSGLLMRPKAEEIEVIYEEKRFEAFWYILGTSHFKYERKVSYKVPVESVVQQVDFQDENYAIDKETKTFQISGIEQCLEDHREEVMINAQTDKPENFSKYLHFPTTEIFSTEELTKDGTPIVNLETKASFLVRSVLNKLIKPIKADKIFEEKICIEKLCLYFLPVYTFEYLWLPKNKKVTVSFDGVTTEFRGKSTKITDKLKHSFTSDELFEFGKEIANFLPGGGLAMMVGRKAIKLATDK
jgi:acylphosphatase